MCARVSLPKVCVPVTLRVARVMAGGHTIAAEGARPPEHRVLLRWGGDPAAVVCPPCACVALDARLIRVCAVPTTAGTAEGEGLEPPSA